MNTVIFDVDGVLADFVLGFMTTAQVSNPCNTVEYNGPWDFSSHLTKEQAKAAWERVRSDRAWWSNLPPLVSPEVFEQINLLQHDNHVLFVTARVSYHNAQEQTQVWLSRNGVTYPNVVVSSKKGDIAAAVGARFHIDDKAENAACVHWLADKTPCKSFYLERQHTPAPWLPKNVARIASVSEYIEAVKHGVTHGEI